MFVVFISIFYAVGLGILGYGIWSMQRSTAARDWPVALGTINSVNLESHTDSDNSTTHQVEISYSYTVSGVDYYSDQLAFGYAGSSSYQFHNEIYSELAPAKEVSVRYDPADPQTAVLSYGVHRSIKFFLTFGFTWLSFVIGFNAIWWVSSSSENILLRNLGIH
jgi:hypothetical protein